MWDWEQFCESGDRAEARNARVNNQIINLVICQIEILTFACFLFVSRLEYFGVFIISVGQNKEFEDITRSFGNFAMSFGYIFGAF